MKNVSLALNAVLLIAVGVLYYLHFSGSKSGSAVSSGGQGITNIAYVNSDSVLKYYEYAKESREKLELKGKRFEQDLKNRAISLQGEIENYQRNRNSLTMGQIQAVEEDLGKKQQNFQLYQQGAADELQNDQFIMSRDLYGKVTEFLKKYGQENGLQIVLKFDPNSDVLYAGDSLDISKQVTDGLNNAYKLETTAKKDSTATK